jgi:mono/diheme cytochrome c family protein
MKHFVIGFASMCAVAAAGTLAFLLLGLADVRADVDTPAPLRAVMDLAVRASVRRHAPAKSPLVAADSDLIAGGHKYLDGCAGCHGTPGRPRPAFTGFIPPPQLPSVGPSYTEPEMYWIIKHGIRHTGMSAYGVFYKEMDMWREAAFLMRIRSLPAAVADSLKLPRN